MNIILGVDPGQSGGIAALTDYDPPTAWKMPDTETDLLDFLRPFGASGTAFAYIERVHSMPKQGVSSTFQFGLHTGGLRMALFAAKIPFTSVSPGVWQRRMGCLSRGDKNVTKRRAQELFPHIKVSHAIADALLIASYGYQEHFGTQGGTHGRRHSP